MKETETEQLRKQRSELMKRMAEDEEEKGMGKK